MLRQFTNDPLFLLRYYLLSILVLAVLMVPLAPARLVSALPWPWLWALLLVPLVVGGLGVIGACALAFLALLLNADGPAFDPRYLLLVPLGVLFGLYMLALTHVAGHRSLRPRWLNRVLGEVFSVPQLIGFAGWCVTHILHHKHADDPERDPHPTGQHSFFAFSAFMKKSIVRRLRAAYLEAFGDSRRSRRLWLATELALVANRLTRALFMLVLLGPVGFVFFFLPSFVGSTLFFIHFNWAAHRPLGDGRWGIVNLDEGWYYKTVNTLLLGSYYHKNHHLHPSLINPKYAPGVGEPGPHVSHTGA